VVARLQAYDVWLAPSPEVPELLLTFDPDGPGILIGSRLAEWCSVHIAGLETESCGYASHVAPEDQPDAIAAAITGWVDRHHLVVGSEPPG
jgi:haloalkane dehalogenase